MVKDPLEKEKDPQQTGVVGAQRCRGGWCARQTDRTDRKLGGGDLCIGTSELLGQGEGPELPWRVPDTDVFNQPPSRLYNTYHI